MKVDILTLFPRIFEGPLEVSLIKKAQERGLLTVYLHNIRDYSLDKHLSVDDYPFGGGSGMVLKPEPIFAAIKNILAQPKESGWQLFLPKGTRIVLMTPQGETLNHKKAEEFSRNEHLIFISGHYEEVDERIKEKLVTDELSIGDYVLTGGELPTLVALDVIVRLIPGVVGCEDSIKQDSFANWLLDFPHYTRPADFWGLKVPEVLLSGNHTLIKSWRRKQSLKRTWERRPDLLARAHLSENDKKLLAEILLENE